jgi:hypothetical protein
MDTFQSCRYQSPYELDQAGEFQDVDKESIDPIKLVYLLRKTFDHGTYELHVSHKTDDTGAE